MVRRNGFVSVRAVGVLTCWLIAAAAVVVAVSWHRARPMGVHPDGIVSLSPALTHLLFQLGAGEDVSGISEYTHGLPPGVSRPVLGNAVQINRELTLWLQPRVIVFQQRPTPTLDRLGADGIELCEIQIETLADLRQAARRLAEVAGKGDPQALIARMDADLRAVERRVAGRRPPRVLLILTGRSAVGSGTFLDELLTSAGGQNVVPFQGYTKPLSDEQICQFGPQVVIDLAAELHGARPVDLADRRRGWDRLSDVPAVRAGRVYVLTDPSITIPDANVGRTARELAQRLHPEAFAVPPASQPEPPAAVRGGVGQPDSRAD